MVLSTFMQNSRNKRPVRFLFWFLAALLSSGASWALCTTIQIHSRVLKQWVQTGALKVNVSENGEFVSFSLGLLETHAELQWRALLDVREGTNRIHSVPVRGDRKPNIESGKQRTTFEFQVSRKQALESRLLVCEEAVNQSPGDGIIQHEIKLSDVQALAKESRP